MKSKSIIGAVTAAALFASSAFAADIAPSKAPLPAGKAAGTKEAAFLALGVWTPLVVGLVIAGFVGAAASGAFQSKNAVTNTQGFQATP